MRFFNRSKPEKPAPEKVTGFRLVTDLGDGTTFNTNGSFYGGGEAVHLRMVDAMATGLRDAGFATDVTLTHETETTR